MADGRVFIITGARGNVGAALGTTLAAAGARLVLVDRSAASLEPLVAGLDGGPARHRAVEIADLAQAGSLAPALKIAQEEFGRLDGLATTVGAFDMAPVAEGPSEFWHRMLNLNLFTALEAVRLVLPVLRRAKSGSIVAIGAGAAMKAPAQLAAYAASKAALLKLVESTADEVKADGVRINAILPGTIDTPQNRAAMPDADPSRWVTPAEVAELIAFLLSDKASGVTGAHIPVTGRG